MRQMIEHEDFPLSTVLYYRIGGTARLFLEAKGRDDVYRALDVVARRGIGRLVVVGLGSNLLFPDGLFDGAVVQVAAPGTPQIRVVGAGLVEAYAGVSLDDVIGFG